MPYKVTSPLVIVPNDDGVSGDGYFYQDAVIPDGFNDKRCKELVKDGMLEKATADSGSDGGSDKEPTVKEILDEVGDDKEKAQTALDAENAKDKPRASLVDPLQKILGKA
ncbi:hypothetical protein C5C07_20385 [Haloferax sp. Atlit-4N]|uniref:hypothetical protein n=1 Tax=Haloferax sp. Atlit-4N TaxID=2077206 RepID=UPI000E2364F7|nr:hypothetical protein [Haloferax sp. Atlit-4N]RDZ49311.1 hypothetical protein C5C07_20385 [Haloferax sp. Atlit-4N]